MSDLLPIVIRDAVPEDDRYWRTNWSRCWWRSRWAGTMPNNLFYDMHRVTIEGLLKRGMRVSVAVLEETPDVVAGFIAHEQSTAIPIVHFVHVKDEWRQNKVATRLIESIAPSREFAYTHRTEDASRFRRPRWKPVHLPEIARRKDAPLK